MGISSPKSVTFEGPLPARLDARGDMDDDIAEPVS